MYLRGVFTAVDYWQLKTGTSPCKGHGVPDYKQRALNNAVTMVNINTQVTFGHSRLSCRSGFPPDKPSESHMVFPDALESGIKPPWWLLRVCVLDNSIGILAFDTFWSAGKNATRLIILVKFRFVCDNGRWGGGGGGRKRVGNNAHPNDDHDNNLQHD